MNRFTIESDPHFCIIAPTAYLNLYAVQSNTHLVLAHLIDKDPVYTAFYKHRSEMGDTIICDNGAFEMGTPYEPHRLVELGKRVGAHALVLPDYPFQHYTVTIRAAEQWLPYFIDNGFAPFYVPQSEKGDLDGWLQSYEWAASNDAISIIGMSILGIPNALPHIPASYARVVMTQLLLRNNLMAAKYHHYLGLNSGPNVELPALIAMGALNSCDSSNPVWMGINGLRYNTTYSDWMGVQKKYIREVDFNEPMINTSKKCHILDTIQYNINHTLELFACRIRDC